MLRVILAALLVTLAATFSTLNREEIALSYFFGRSTPPFPLFLLLLASLAAGMILGFSADWAPRRKLRAEMRELGKRVKSLKKEIESLDAHVTSPAPSAPTQVSIPPPRV